MHCRYLGIGIGVADSGCLWDAAIDSTAPDVVMLLGTPVGTSAQATLAAALTQEKYNADNQAAATAEIMRANAQATLNSANAQATLVAAGSTQSAALTQDAIRQTQA